MIFYPLIDCDLFIFSKEEVNKLMSQGKRHFVCNEIVEAVKCFESVCLML